MQKVTDTDLSSFLTKDLTMLDCDQKYLLFKKLELPIQYAVNKAVKKFHSLPLETDDFTTIAWIAFEDVLNKYQKNLTRKSFISYVIDSVYWKSLDYACSFINNRHRILNNINMEFNWVENPRPSDDLGKQLTTKMIVEDYFQKLPNRQLTMNIFNDYLYQTPVLKIAENTKFRGIKLGRFWLKQSLI